MKLNCKSPHVFPVCRFVLKHKLSVFFLFEAMKTIRFRPYANNAKL